VSEEVSWQLSTMSTDSVRLATPMQAGSRRAASAIGMLPSLRQRRFSQSKMKNLESPDGELLSEHTRVTLIPHRLTLTKSGQVLVGGAETTDPKSVTSIAAQATKKHRITRSGLNILNRLVFYSISFGSGHCAAVTDTGLIYTWGQGRYGQLGHGDEADKIVPQPVRGITGKVKAVSASFYHNLAVTVNGHVFSWGDGKEGKLGHNDNAGRLLPTIVSYFVDRGLHVIAAQAGGSHSCALTSFYQIYTFGSGGNGRLGHGNDRDQWVPTMVSALELYAVVSLAAGYAHTAALTDDGQIFTCVALRPPLPRSTSLVHCCADTHDWRF
jgi:alpha-tubulin suppressor-like RCC1 family protein